MNTAGAVETFFTARRIALIGASRDPKDFSRAVMRELRGRGYDVVPVNPGAGDLEGERCWPAVGAIQPPVEAALVMTPPARTTGVVRECLDAGIRLLWLHRGAGQGSVTAEAVRVAEAAGAMVVPGACPLMYVRDTGFMHRVHRWVHHLFGRGHAA